MKLRLKFTECVCLANTEFWQKHPRVKNMISIWFDLKWIKPFPYWISAKRKLSDDSVNKPGRCRGQSWKDMWSRNPVSQDKGKRTSHLAKLNHESALCYINRRVGRQFCVAGLRFPGLRIRDNAHRWWSPSRAVECYTNPLKTSWVTSCRLRERTSCYEADTEFKDFWHIERKRFVSLCRKNPIFIYKSNESSLQKIYKTVGKYSDVLG